MSLLENQVIQKIKDNKRWTISDQNKVPINFVRLRDLGRVEGAYMPDHTCLSTLEDVASFPFKNPKYAYFIRSEIDKICVLDIESSCPDDIKEWLLSVPHLYAERSLSGLGYHLILDLPEEFDSYPDYIKNKISLSEKPYYEILLEHYVTFTGDEVDLSNREKTTSIDEVFQRLIKTQKKKEETKSVKISHIDLEDIPKANEVILIVNNNTNEIDPSRYLNPTGEVDNSKYEYAYACAILRQTKRVLKLNKFKNLKYDDNKIITLSAKILESRLTYRKKHSTTRSNIPWLLWVTKKAYESYYDLF